jgi:hypothetical protein
MVLHRQEGVVSLWDEYNRLANFLQRSGEDAPRRVNLTLRCRWLTDVAQIDANLAKVHVAMRELNLKYTILPRTRTVLVKYGIDGQTSFTLVIEIYEQWVNLRIPLARSSDIGGLIRSELFKRLLTGNGKNRIARFSIDQSGNVGTACDLAIEDFTPASLARQVRAITASMLLFYTDIARPLTLRCGDQTTIESQSKTATARKENEPFEIDVCDLAHGSSAKLMITMHTTVREILLEAIKRLALQTGDYFLVHNGRKLGPEQTNNTANSLAISRGDSLDIMLANHGMQSGSKLRLLSRTFAKH